MIDTQEDKEKFETLYETYRKLLFYVANQILKDEYLAEDAVHHTFLKVLGNLDKIHEINCHKTKSYLVVMVRNHSINLYNRRKKHPLLPLDESVSEDGTDALTQAEEADALTRAVLMLPELYQSILTLKYVQGFSSRDIAAMLDITETAVRKRLERVKKKLREIIDKEDDVHDSGID
jgi:RNA polymerase sigma-70 factor (ECF subfamily)